MESEGWTRTIGADGVSAKNGDVGAVIAYSLAIDDQLRAAPHFAEGVWDKLIGDDYTAGTRTSGGDGSGELAFSEGAATDKASGSQVYVMVVSERNNGIAFPIIAVAADQATLKAKLPTATSVNELRRLNAFPLRCTGLAGGWTSSDVSAAETYDASGSFTGLVVSALRIDLSFTADAKYTRKISVYQNTSEVKEDDSGSYAATDTAITLTSSAGKTTNYGASYVAVRGGLALYIQNQQFSGDNFVLYRAK